MHARTVDLPTPTPTPPQTQSFPFESLAYPKLWDGAFSPDERYLQAEVADIVEFARLRGIRVVPEFDVVRLRSCACDTGQSGSRPHIKP